MDCSTADVSDLPTAETQNGPILAEWLSLSPTSIHEITEVAQEAFKNIQEAVISLYCKVQKKISLTAIAPNVIKSHSICTDVERLFNILGCLPWVGGLCGSIRTILGQAQTILGIALVAMSETSLHLEKISPHGMKLTSKWKMLSKFGIELTVHGYLNVIRGTGEMLIGSCTFGLGNVILIVPNFCNQQNFAPYFPYGSIINPSLPAEDETLATVVLPPLKEPIENENLHISLP